MYSRGDEVSRPRSAPLKVLSDPVAHAHRNCGGGIHVPLLQEELCTHVPVVANPLHAQHSEARSSVLPVRDCPNRAFELLPSPTRRPCGKGRVKSGASPGPRATRRWPAPSGSRADTSEGPASRPRRARRGGQRHVGGDEAHARVEVRVEVERRRLEQRALVEVAGEAVADDEHGLPQAEELVEPPAGGDDGGPDAGPHGAKPRDLEAGREQRQGGRGVGPRVGVGLLEGDARLATETDQDSHRTRMLAATTHRPRRRARSTTGRYRVDIALISGAFRSLFGPGWVRIRSRS